MTTNVLLLRDTTATTKSIVSLNPKINPRKYVRVHMLSHGLESG